MSPAAPSARISLDALGASVGVYRTPATLPAVRGGEVTIVLGTLPSGRPVTLTVSSREWLDDLIEAAADARAKLSPAMVLVVTP